MECSLLFANSKVDKRNQSLIRAASGCRTEHDLRVIEQRRRIDELDLGVSVTMTRALPDAESVSGGR